ncbi:transposase [Azotobacter chroococcum]|uniref:Transposase n=1 Tax=Azotobacter chroococcum TaxID=353 RepID=A0AAP9YDL0_9GAMM|nr:transposase [Azotobacter chroococcum]
MAERQQLNLYGDDEARLHHPYTQARSTTALRNLAIAFEHYNEQHPHSALKYCSPRELRRLAKALTY